MGEYYTLVNHTKKEYLDPCDIPADDEYDHQIQFYAVTNGGENLKKALMMMIIEGRKEDPEEIYGRWARDSVSLCGDQSEAGCFWQDEGWLDISFLFAQNKIFTDVED